jgi:hypothetical protein
MYNKIGALLYEFSQHCHRYVWIVRLNIVDSAHVGTRQEQAEMIPIGSSTSYEFSTPRYWEMHSFVGKK